MPWALLSVFNLDRGNPSAGVARVGVPFLGEFLVVEITPYCEGALRRVVLGCSFPSIARHAIRVVGIQGH